MTAPDISVVVCTKDRAALLQGALASLYDLATEDGLTSPIEPPVPLFDSSALGGKGDVDDPVSGGGNPALMETTAGPSACQSEGSQAASQCKQEKQP